MQTTKILTAMLACVCACATNEQTTEDGRDDDFVQDGKADVGGVVEGSPEAIAVLALANDSTRETLRSEILISELAVDAIVAVRLGDDGEAGTGDDVWFSTLSELDAVPYVGPGVFAKLLGCA